MEAVFLKAVNLSINAGWLVLAILVLRLLLRRGPRWIFCLLWGLAALRLVCPVSVESAVSLLPSAEALPPDILYTAEPKIESGVEAIDGLVNPVFLSSLAPASEAVSVNPAQIWAFVLARVWVFGAALMLVYALVSWGLLRRRIADATLLRGNIRQSEKVGSPFVLGLFRPVIYLPYRIAEEDIDYVVAHERAHIRRGDPWWKLLGFWLLSVYWFHPLLWVAYALFCRDIEAACDEKVIGEMEKKARHAYSLALLRCSAGQHRIAGCPLAFGETGVKKRVKYVMDYRKPAFWFVLLASAVVVVTAVCMLTDPKEEGMAGAAEAEGLKSEVAGLEVLESGSAEAEGLESKTLGLEGSDSAAEGIEGGETGTAEETVSVPFADGQPLKLLYASGAGSWGTTLTLYPDGSFAGTYQEGENDSSPEYPRGTSYVCQFTGRFGEMKRLTQYAYSLTLEELVFEEAGKEWVEDGILYISAEPLGLAGGDEFVLYVPETSAEELNGYFLEWWPDAWRWREGSQKTLQRYGLCNTATGAGFFTSRLTGQTHE